MVKEQKKRGRPKVDKKLVEKTQGYLETIGAIANVGGPVIVSTFNVPLVKRVASAGERAGAPLDTRSTLPPKPPPDKLPKSKKSSSEPKRKYIPRTPKQKLEEQTLSQFKEQTKELQSQLTPDRLKAVKQNYNLAKKSVGKNITDPKVREKTLANIERDMVTLAIEESQQRRKIETVPKPLTPEKAAKELKKIKKAEKEQKKVESYEKALERQRVYAAAKREQLQEKRKEEREKKAKEKIKAKKILDKRIKKEIDQEELTESETDEMYKQKLEQLPKRRVQELKQVEQQLSQKGYDKQDVKELTRRAIDKSYEREIKIKDYKTYQKELSPETVNRIEREVAEARERGTTPTNLSRLKKNLIVTAHEEMKRKKETLVIKEDISKPITVIPSTWEEPSTEQDIEEIEKIPELEIEKEPPKEVVIPKLTKKQKKELEKQKPEYRDIVFPEGIDEKRRKELIEARETLKRRGTLISKDREYYGASIKIAKRHKTTGVVDFGNTEERFVETALNLGSIEENVKQKIRKINAEAFTTTDIDLKLSEDDPYDWVLVSVTPHKKVAIFDDEGQPTASYEKLDKLLEQEYSSASIKLINDEIIEKSLKQKPLSSKYKKLSEIEPLEEDEEYETKTSDTISGTGIR